MSDKMKCVYVVTPSSAPVKLICHDFDHAIEHIKADMDDAEEGQRFSYELGIVYMTEEELENLPDYDD